MLRVLQTSGRISYLADLKTSLFCCDPTHLRNSTGLRGARSIISGYPVVEIDKQKSGRSKSYPLVPRMSDKVIVKHRKEEGGKFTFSFHLKISDSCSANALHARLAVVIELHQLSNTQIL